MEIVGFYVYAIALFNVNLIVVVVVPAMLCGIVNN